MFHQGSGAVLKQQEGGMYCRICIDYTLGQAHFLTSGNNLFTTVVHMKAQGEGKRQHRVVVFVFY